MELGLSRLRAPGVEGRHTRKPVARGAVVCERDSVVPLAFSSATFLVRRCQRQKLRHRSQC